MPVLTSKINIFLFLLMRNICNEIVFVMKKIVRKWRSIYKKCEEHLSMKRWWTVRFFWRLFISILDCFKHNICYKQKRKKNFSDHLLSWIFSKFKLKKITEGPFIKLTRISPKQIPYLLGRFWWMVGYVPFLMWHSQTFRKKSIFWIF